MSLKNKIEERVADGMDKAPKGVNIREAALFSKFFSVGIITTLLDWTIFAIAVFFGMYSQYALFLSYSCGAIVNFLFNRSLTFKKEDKTGSRFAKFVVIVIISYLLSAFLLKQFVALGWHAILARIIVTFIIFVLNYILHRNITFK
jgi:putative flippase GtrA